MLRRVLTAGFCVAAFPALAQTAQGDVAVTIYNSNLSLVQDSRTLNLPAGRSRQDFPDVSAMIRPQNRDIGGCGLLRG